MNRTILTLLLFGWLGGFAQVPIPAGKQEVPIFIKGATIHIGNGDLIEKGEILFDNGKILQVGKMGSITVPEGARVIDAAGKDIYPGFIAPTSTLGLVEIGAVRATRDQNEVGDLNPNVRSIIAYNADSKIPPTVRSNGVLMAQCTPSGGTIPGSSSIITLDAWNWEDAVYKENDAIHLNWPRMFVRRGWWAQQGV
ncbi:MAG: amidohydrolase, partial [Bacteroidetes bacterium]|nr:amidohydrolase [Bacteroidota bacterium]